MEFTFTAEIIFWRGPAPFYFLKIPKKFGAEIKAISKEVTYGWGVIPVFAKGGGSEWKTSLFPKDGDYLLPIKKLVREKAGLDEGDSFTVYLEI